jgi:hypothetical protein
MCVAARASPSAMPRWPAPTTRDPLHNLPLHRFLKGQRTQSFAADEFHGRCRPVQVPLEVASVAAQIGEPMARDRIERRKDPEVVAPRGIDADEDAQRRRALRLRLPGQGGLRRSRKGRRGHKAPRDASADGGSLANEGDGANGPSDGECPAWSGAPRIEAARSPGILFGRTRLGLPDPRQPRGRIKRRRSSVLERRRAFPTIAMSPGVRGWLQRAA